MSGLDPKKFLNQWDKDELGQLEYGMKQWKKHNYNLTKGEDGAKKGAQGKSGARTDAESKGEDGAETGTEDGSEAEGEDGTEDGTEAGADDGTGTESELDAGTTDGADTDTGTA